MARPSAWPLFRASLTRCYETFLVTTSVVTPKPANGSQGKTGQREEAGDSVVLSCSLLWRQVYFCAPTPRTAFEYVTMMEEAIEHGGDGGTISQQFAPVFHWSVGSEQSTGALIAAHDDLQQFLDGGGGELAQTQVINYE